MAKKNLKVEDSKSLVNEVMSNDTEVVAVAQDLTEGLESEVEVAETTETASIDYSSIEFLMNNAPFFPQDHSSSKLNKTREPKVQLGIETIRTIDPNFPTILLLFGLWWENKAARSEIKKMIDAEAEAKGVHPQIYMQENMRKWAEKYDMLQSAVDRLKYAVNYWKPRNGIKDAFKQFEIRGVYYNVNLTKLAELRAKHADNREALLDELIQVSQEIVVDTI